MKKRVVFCVLMVLMGFLVLGNGYYIADPGNMEALHAYVESGYDFPRDVFVQGEPPKNVPFSPGGKEFTLYHEKGFFNLNGVLYVAKLKKDDPVLSSTDEHYARQCVDFVRGMVRDLPAASLDGSGWKKLTGDAGQDWKHMPPGTVIATFDGNAFKGHVALFDKYENGQVWVFDQNFAISPTDRNTMFRYRFLREDEKFPPSKFYAVSNPTVPEPQTPNAVEWQPAKVAEGIYYINIPETDLVLDVENWEMANGGRLIAYPLHKGTNQQFLVKPMANGEYILQNIGSGKVVEIQNGDTSSGARVQQWEYNPEPYYSYMRWKLYTVGQGIYVIENAKTGTVLGLEGNGKSAFTAIVAGEKAMAPTATGQGFRLIPQDVETVEISAQSGFGGEVRVGESENWGMKQTIQWEKNQEVTVEARASEGYTFAGWYENYAKKSEEAKYTFQATTPITLRAQFNASSNQETSSRIPEGMVLVKAGSFEMGNTRGDSEGDSDEKPVHRVTLTYDYWIWKYEVTFAEYDLYCESVGKSKPSDRGWGRGSRPVMNVSWNDAIGYCNWLSEKEGLAKAYDGNGNLLDGNGRTTRDITKVEGYRLPTEAEWEYAARGGHKSAGDYKYAGSNNLGNVGWYWQNSGDKWLAGDDSDRDLDTMVANNCGTHPVGQKAANELGIYDMSGNVWEWCHDWWDSDWYEEGRQTNPVGPSQAGSYRVKRGGCWYSYAGYCRVAGRDCSSPGDSDFSLSDFSLGLRLSRTY